MFRLRCGFLTCWVLVLGSFGFTPNTQAFDLDDFSATSLGLRAGSAGWGAEYKMKLRDPIDFRLVWQTLKPGKFELQTDELGGNFYRANGNFRSSGAIADWHPWPSEIRFSIGIFRNTSSFILQQTSSTSGIQNNYSADFGNLAYFFGAGWAARDNPHRFTLTLDVGMLAQQPAQVNWVPDNQVRNTAQEAQIWSEKKAITRELNDYKLLPVLMIGLSYQIF